MAHVTVLQKEAVDGLSITPGDVVVDGTLGSGGHAQLIASALEGQGTLVGIDQDSEAIERSRNLLKDIKCKTHFVEGNFRNLSSILSELSINSIDALLLDLGLNSEQLESSGRGFSFQKSEPLSMTFSSDPETANFTAETILNEWEEESIADIIYGYGEERFARSIAKKIVELRSERAFSTTLDLVDAIEKAVPAWYRGKRTHPATKTFQALRIAVNDEIEALRDVLTNTLPLLSDKGRIAIISFHSIEDRLVKRTFATWEDEEKGIRITRKPIIPTEEETKDNPRARSAKLRIFEKHVYQNTHQKK